MNYLNQRGVVGVALLALAASILGACASQPKPPSPIARAVPPPPPAYTPPPPPAPVENSPAPGSLRDFVVNVGERVYFDYDRYQLRPDALPILAAQAGWLIRYPDVRVRIEGNCDERGTEAYNFALGARRAQAVREFLMAHGIDSSRITTVSYGKDRPIDSGTGELAWQHNRNGHTAIISGAR